MIDLATSVESKMLECFGMENHDDKIRADERRKLLNWLDDNDALGTEVYDSKHFCYYHQRLSPEELLKDYEESMKGDN